jgi:hypothetical protein
VVLREKDVACRRVTTAPLSTHKVIVGEAGR